MRPRSASHKNRKANRMPFDSLDDIRAFCRDLPGGDRRFADMAAQRQQNLTKPPGSLGRLEELAIWLAQWPGREHPAGACPVAVFAGITASRARLSAYPQAVTAQMVEFRHRRCCHHQIAKASPPLRVVPIELECLRRFHRDRGDDVGGSRRVRRRISPVPTIAICCRSQIGIANTTAAATLCAAARAARRAGRPRHRRRRRWAGAQARRSRPRCNFRCGISASPCGAQPWRPSSRRSPAPARRAQHQSRCCSRFCGDIRVAAARALVCALDHAAPHVGRDPAHRDLLRELLGDASAARPDMRSRGSGSAVGSCWRSPRCHAGMQLPEPALRHEDCRNLHI